MEERKIKLFIGAPVHSQVSMHFMQACLNLQQFCLLNNIPVIFYLLQGSLITSNRNLCVSQFMQSDCTHLLFIDSDIYFSVETVMQMLKIDKEVIACPYPMKQINYEKLWDKIQKKQVNNAQELASQGLVFPVKVKNDKSILTPEGYMEISHAPTGCLLIKREAIEKMIEAYPEDQLEEKQNPADEEPRPYFYNFFDCYHDKENKKYYGEDFGFSLKWSKIGGKIYAYIMEPIAHIGDNAYYGRMYDDLTYKKPIK